MKSWVEKQFELLKNGTNVKMELIAGAATFVTMAYVLATVPNILGDTGVCCRIYGHSPLRRRRTLMGVNSLLGAPQIWRATRK